MTRLRRMRQLSAPLRAWAPQGKCHGVLLTLVLLFAAHPLTAERAATLLDRSPFIPSTFSPPQPPQPPVRPTPPQQQQEFEFRGIYQINGNYRFLISEARSRSGRWLQLGAKEDNIEVRAFNADNDLLTIAVNGDVREIKLASTESNPAPQPVASVSPQPTARTAAGPAPGTARPQQRRPAPTATSTDATPQPTQQPVRRTIRPSTHRPGADAVQDTVGETPTPEWLQELRQRAAERRQAAEAGQ